MSLGRHPPNLVLCRREGVGLVTLPHVYINDALSVHDSAVLALNYGDKLQGLAGAANVRIKISVGLVPPGKRRFSTISNITGFVSPCIYLQMALQWRAPALPVPPRSRGWGGGGGSPPEGGSGSVGVRVISRSSVRDSMDTGIPGGS